MGFSYTKVVRALIYLVGALILTLIILNMFSNSAAASLLRQERCIYVIKKFGISVGKATLEYKGEVNFEGRKAIQIIFTAKGFKFSDEEKIYADPETLLPIRVERDLNIFGKKEKLIEFYDQEKNSVRIVKYKKGKKVDEMFFEQEQPIDNLYCFLYRYRRSGVFEKGSQFQMYLPTKEVKFEVIRKEDVGFSDQDSEAWFMESKPSAYRVWFGVSEGNIPLRIDGAVGLAKTVMILTDHQFGKIK